MAGINRGCLITKFEDEQKIMFDENAQGVLNLRCMPSGPRATLLHLYRGNDRVSFSRSEFKNHHAILGIHFETPLIGG